MTNWEIFKKDLKPEDFAVNPCRLCNNLIRRECVQYGPCSRGFVPESCRKAFLEWAKTEAVEEEKVVYGMDKGDPKGDDTVISAKKRDEEPLIFPYNENGPVAKCPKCGEICHIDVTGKYGYCVWCKRFKLGGK